MSGRNTTTQTREQPGRDIPEPGSKGNSHAPSHHSANRSTPTRNGKTPSGIDQAPIGNQILKELALWALEETHARTLGEAILEAAGRAETPHEWRNLAGIPLERLASPRQHPYEVLEDLAGRLSPRGRTILESRIAAGGEARTLSDIAREFGVTGERIRQVEKTLRRKMKEHIGSKRGTPVARTVREVRETLGTAGPGESVERLLKAPPGLPDYREIILELAGPYGREEDGWLVLEDARPKDPAPGIIEVVDDVGRINETLAHRRLTLWGLRTERHEAWLLRNPCVRKFRDRLVRWGASIEDRMVLALTEIGEPTPVQQLMECLEERSSKNSTINRMGLDPRLVRANISRWGLADWEYPEYRGAAQSIKAIILEEGGRARINLIVQRMLERFQVIESTTKTYCTAPMFVREMGTLRLRIPSDRPFRCRRESIRRHAGIFDLGWARVGRLVEIDEDALRGSGSNLTEAGGAILQVQVNDRMTFRDSRRNEVRVTFPETIPYGPAVGSIRKLAEQMDARMGDHLTLVLDRPRMSFSAQLTRPEECSRSWETIGRLTGITGTVNRNRLAHALGCREREVPEVLRERGDNHVLEWMPRLTDAG